MATGILTFVHFETKSAECFVAQLSVLKRYISNQERLSHAFVCAFSHQCHCNVTGGRADCSKIETKESWPTVK